MDPHYEPSPWTAYGLVHGLSLWTPPPTTPKIKLTKEKKQKQRFHLLLVHGNRSLVSKFRALCWENITDLCSVSGANYIIGIPHCHFFFPVAISIYKRLGNLREASKFELLECISFAILFSRFVNSCQASQFCSAGS